MNHLPKKQFASWSELIVEAYHHGMANMDPLHLEKAKELLFDDIDSSFLRGSDTPAVRPSGGINCAGQTALIAEGFGAAEDARDLPRMLFATGHFHHNMLYAALLSALPKEAFHLEIEEEVDLAPLDWWPKVDGFKQQGHIDLQLTCLDDDWLAPSAPRKIMADVKTRHSLGMKRKQDIITPSNDVWGNLSQLAVYSALKGTVDSGAILVYVNREVPKALGNRVKCSYIFPEFLNAELEAVKDRMDKAVRGEFDPEMWRRKHHGGDLEKEFVPCQGSPVPYCPVASECEKRREGMFEV